jgi:hypothetical protein
MKCVISMAFEPLRQGAEATQGSILTVCISPRHMKYFQDNIMFLYHYLYRVLSLKSWTRILFPDLQSSAIFAWISMCVWIYVSLFSMCTFLIYINTWHISQRWFCLNLNPSSFDCQMFSFSSCELRAL